MMKAFIAFTLFLAGSSAFTKFEKCGGTLSLSSKKCFKTVLEEINVQIGVEGTDDDVVIEVCSDYKVTDCCKTVALKHTFKDDWRKNSQQSFKKDKFGACKDKEFTVRNALQVTISKQGGKKDPLIVRNLDLYTKPKDKKLTEREQFRCGYVELETRRTPELKQTLFCEPLNKFHAIHQATFSIGNKDGSGKTGDGTNDDVSVKICSDANNQCCQRKLDAFLSNDWQRGAVEKWDADHFGNCSEVLYKIKNYPQITLSKVGKDSLKVDNVTLDMDIRDRNWETKPMRLRTFCNDANVKFDVDCKTSALCTHTWLNCKKQILAVDSKGKTIEPNRRQSQRTTKKPKVTTTTKKPTTTTTTKKPSEKKGASGLLSSLLGRR